jgi:hypothetical protein
LRDPHHKDAKDADDDLNGDGGMDADEMRDYEDQVEHMPLSSTANLGPYARFLQTMPDYNDMTQEEFDQAVRSLPLPSARPSTPGISIHAAIEASYIYRYTDIVSDVVYDIVLYFDMSISYMISYLISFAISYTIL